MPRRVLQGVVLVRTEKTANVLVTRTVTHDRYRKIIKKTKKYLVHDENNASKVGDVVRFIECPPLSKRKSWTLI